MKLNLSKKLEHRVQGVEQKNLASSLRKKNYSWLLACSFWVLVSNSLAYPAFSINLTEKGREKEAGGSYDVSCPLPTTERSKGMKLLPNQRFGSFQKVGDCNPYQLLPSALCPLPPAFLNPNPSALAERENINGGVKSLCSEQNLETLIIELLQDLPSYTNRASQRARRLRRSSDVYSYMLVAGRPEFTPLPLNLEEYSADTSKSSASGVEQVFFTTLERRYIGKKAVELQEFHWLFLTKTKTGWRLVMMFSQIGSYSGQQPVSPPRDSSNGTVAQGVKTWLRDCQAGSVRRMRAVFDKQM